MNRTLRTPILLGIFAALASGCAVVRTTVQPPEFQVQQFQLVRYTIPNILNPFNGEATFLMDVRVTNPNAFGLQVRRIDGELLLDGQNFGKATIPNLRLEPNQSTTVTTEFTLPVNLNLASKIADIASGKRVDYLVKSTIQVDAGLIGTATFSNIVVAQGNVNR
ncbi:LEA type 2 family protein [Deinococcus misasensis]|uniref:LEA type 2 family protein n=1 Tax=Deinococcus misasensis TaxID=392413 RepID=UPI0005578E81|nr:LEA type 2 family protein [Deinococcus misasensis]